MRRVLLSISKIGRYFSRLLSLMDMLRVHVTGRTEGGVRVDRVEEKTTSAEERYVVVHGTHWQNVKWSHCASDADVNPTGWIWMLGGMKVAYVTQSDSISGAYVIAMLVFIQLLRT